MLLRKFTASRPSRIKLLELTCIISKSTRPSIRPEAILVKQTKKLHIMNRNIFYIIGVIVVIVIVLKVLHVF